MGLIHLPVGRDASARLAPAIDGHDRRLSQKFITSCTPGQNAIIEGFSRSQRQECTWFRYLETFDEAKKTITTWIRFDNGE